MSAENAKLQNLLQRADQLTDDQHYLEAVDALKEYPVVDFHYYIQMLTNCFSFNLFGRIN